MALLLAMATFVVVAAVFFLPFVLVGGQSRELEIVRRRLEAIEKARARDQSSLELDLLRNELLSNVPTIHRFLLRFGWSTWLREFLAQAGMTTKPGNLILMSAGLVLGAFVVAYQLLHNPLAAAGAGVGAGFIPLAVVAFKRWRRLREFEKNFPDAIDLLGRAVRAGHAFTTGMEMIATELPDPVAMEFRIAFEEQNLGLPLKDALFNLAERVPLLDVRFFVTALLIQKETGGNLAEILDNLSYVIRDRFRIYGEVRVRTAQGRLTAGILIALPPIMMTLLTSINPGYIRPLFHDPWGPYLLVAAGTLQLVGSALLWKIVHIEV